MLIMHNTWCEHEKRGSSVFQRSFKGNAEWRVMLGQVDQAWDLGPLAVLLNSIKEHVIRVSPLKVNNPHLLWCYVVPNHLWLWIEPKSEYIWMVQSECMIAVWLRGLLCCKRICAVLVSTSRTVQHCALMRGVSGRVSHTHTFLTRLQCQGSLRTARGS